MQSFPGVSTRTSITPSPLRREYKNRGNKDVKRGEPSGLAACLEEFIHGYSELFRAGNHRQASKVHEYLQGIVLTDRCNIERMSGFVPDMDYQAHHNLISVSPWADRPVRDRIINDVDRIIGDSPDTCLIFDETAFTKKGKHSAGVARQWSGQLGKVENCQVGVFAVLADKKDNCLVDGRLYLPEDWVKDPQRCDKAGIPEADQVFKSKTVLALEIMADIDASKARYGWVLADAGYGKEPNFLIALNQKDKRFLVDVHKTQTVYLSDPLSDKWPSGQEGVGLRLRPKPIKVQDLVDKVDESEWKWVTPEIGSKGPKRVKALHRRVWIFDKATNQAYQWHLVVRRKGRGEPDDTLKFSLSNAAEDTPFQKLVWAQGHRFKVEQSFQEGKQELGMDDYQVRGWRGWHHHITLIMLANRFLMEMKRIHRKSRPFLSMRDVLELLIVLLPKRKISQEEILRQIDLRHKQRRRDLRRNRQE